MFPQCPCICTHRRAAACQAQHKEFTTFSRLTLDTEWLSAVALQEGKREAGVQREAAQAAAAEAAQLRQTLRAAAARQRVRACLFQYVWE